MESTFKHKPGNGSLHSDGIRADAVTKNERTLMAMSNGTVPKGVHYVALWSGDIVLETGERLVIRAKFSSRAKLFVGEILRPAEAGQAWTRVGDFSFTSVPADTYTEATFRVGTRAYKANISRRTSPRTGKRYLGISFPQITAAADERVYG